MSIAHSAPLPSAASMLAALGRNRTTPLRAVAEITRRCNLACRHCFQTGRASADLTTRQWRLILGRLADSGVLFLTLTGGEPTTRADFLEIVRHARSLSFAVRVKTNGTLLSPSQCMRLAQMSVLEVHVSLYSADSVLHDALVGIPGAHARTVAAARALRDGGVRVVVGCPLTAATFEGYPRLIQFADAERFAFVLDPSIAVREDGCADCSVLRLSADQTRRLLSDPRMSATRPREPRPRRPREGPVCGAGRSFVTVAANGDVWPCIRIPERAGSLLETPLETIWIGNPTLRKYTVSWSDLPICGDCRLRDFCSRCHADAMIEDGDLYGPSRLACQKARVRAELWWKAHGRRGKPPEPLGLAERGRPGILARGKRGSAGLEGEGASGSGTTT